MNKSEITVKLEKLLKKRLSISMYRDMYDDHLFSKKISMSPRCLVYIYFLVQEEFCIQIDKKYILSSSFCTINNIVDIIYKALHTKEAGMVN